MRVSRDDTTTGYGLYPPSLLDIFQPRAAENAGHRVVSIVTAVFEDRDADGDARHRPRNCPRSREGLGIFDCEQVIERVCVHARVTFDQGQGIPRALEICPRAEVF